MRGEREFLVSSDMKLKDFKVKVCATFARACGPRKDNLKTSFSQLMEAFKVATYDQNLMVNGVYLTENEASLGQLKVLPGSLIFLRVSVKDPTILSVK